MFKLSHILAIYEVKNNSQSSDTPIWGIVRAKEVKKNYYEKVPLYTLFTFQLTLTV